MTFLHHEWDSGILTLEGGWDKTNDRSASLAMKKTDPTKPSKKISLSEYNKMRSKSAASSSAEDQPASKPIEQGNATKEIAKPKSLTTPAEGEKSMTREDPQLSEQRGQKR
jgi:hypothetical protein